MADFTKSINSLSTKYNKAEQSTNKIRTKIANSETKVTGKVFQQKYKSLVNMDAQLASRYEVIIYPAPYSFGSNAMENASALARGALAANDLNIMNLNAQSITISTYKFEYENDGSGMKYVKNVVYPESISINFIEDSRGSVRSFMERWIEDVGTIEMDSGLNNPQEVMIFNENQMKARKNARIILLDTIGKASGGMFSVYGMRPMEIGDVTLEQNSPDPLTLSITFTVDNAYFGSMGGAIGGIISNALTRVL